MNKKLLPLFIGIALFSLESQIVQAAEQTAAPVSVGVGSEYYTLGGGQVLPPPGSGRVTFNINARLQVGFGYSCGKFNFHNNIEQMINQFQSRLRQLPGQLQQAVQAAIAGLPGYLMQKYNPTLYNILTKTLDESAELFNMSYKTCEQMESEMARDPNANPYDGFFRASIAEKWRDGGNVNNAVAPDVYEDIKSSPAEPIQWLGGRLYGTTFNPVQINHDLVVAGYNIMLGRTGDVSVTTAPTGTLVNEPIVQIWSTPADAGRWAQTIVGDLRIILTGSNQNRSTIPGKGLRPKVMELRTEIEQAFNLAYNQNDYSQIKTFGSLNVTPALIESLKSMNAGERAVLRGRLIEEMAVKETVERTFLILQMLNTGSQAPDVTSSVGGAAADEYLRNNTLPAFEAKIDEIIKDIELKSSTLTRTSRDIISRSNQTSSSSRGKQ